MILLRKFHSISPCAALAAAILLWFCPSCLSAPSGAPAAQRQSYTVYYLKRGEGLADVAKKYGVPLGEVIRLNRSRLPDPKNPDRVFAGMAVRVPVPPAKAVEPEAPAEKAVQAPPPAAVEPSGPAPGRAPAPAEQTPSPAPAPAKTAPAAPSPDTPAAPEKPPAAPVRTAPAPDERLFPEDKTLETISPEARRLAEAEGLTGPAIHGPWVYVVLGSLAVLLLAGVWMLVWFRRALREISGGAAAARGGVRDTGDLMLVAARSLGRNSRLFWFKAGQRDVFVSTGAETRILLPEEERAQEEGSGRQQEELRPAVSRVSSGRRPRKAAPQEVQPPADEDSSPPADAS